MGNFNGGEMGQSNYSGTGTEPEGSIKDTMKDTANQFKEQAAEKATAAKNAIAGAGQKAMDKMNEQRQSAASALDRAASSLHNTADTFPGQMKTSLDSVADAAHATADKIQATAEYVRHNDFAAMGKDVVGMVKRYPGPSLLAAVVVGVLVGRSFRRSD